MNKLIVIGASGHGKVIADIARLNGFESIVFLDDDASVKTCAGYPVLGGTNLDIPDGQLFIAVGNALLRKQWMEAHADREFPILIHPRAVVASSSSIGKGTVVMAGAVINPDAKIGRGCIVNTCSSIDHDCVVGDFCHVSVGAHLSGSVVVRENTWVGAGAIVSNDLNICANCMIGAGTVVVRDIVVSGTYVGIPAKKVK